MLEISGLTRRFGATTVLHDVSMSQQRGEIACIVGPSGCGKSTLLRLVAGLDEPDAGEIFIDGKRVSVAGDVVQPHRRSINMVFQDYALWPHMRVSKIVGYGLSHINRADRDRRVRELLRLMRIEALAERLPSELSGGQQQRVAIARALATNPRVLLLDEPLSNLDVQLRTEMRLEFAELFRSVETTALYVTHDPLEASSFADRLIVMRKGQIEQEGAPEALFAAPSSEWVALLAGYDVRLRVANPRHINGALVADIGDHMVHLNTEADPSKILDASAATLMLHPSSIRFGDAASAHENRIRGTVVSSLFEGRQWRVSLRVSEDQFSLVVPFRCTAGEQILFSFSKHDAIAFPQAS
jgi:putative spermidine/putrescine transport system ATP-binding protein